jgi:hypothetical protein
MGKLTNLNPPLPITDNDIPDEIARDSEVTAAINVHVATTDPHTQYLLPAEGDARYKRLGTSDSFGPTAKITVTSMGTVATPSNNPTPIWTGLEVQASPTNAAAHIFFQRPGLGGVHFGLDTNNALCVGGWSLGNSSYRMWNEAYGTPVWQAPSDKALKQNIRPIPSGLGLILECKPVSFRYNRVIRDNKNFFVDSFQREKIHYGFLANEFPLQDLVSQKGDDYLGLDYLEIIPFLCRAIQEQQEQVELLKQQVELLKVGFIRGMTTTE